MDNDNIITLYDSQGNVVTLEFLDVIPFLDKEYAALLPLDDQEGEIVILELCENSNGEEEFLSVDNPSMVEAIFELFKERNKDTFNFY